MSNQNMINSTSMPPQEVPAMPPGSKGLMDAGIKMQQQQTANQMSLIGQGKTGGSKRRHMRGGVVVQVPPVPAGTPNGGATGDSYKGLTTLSQQQSSQAVFDNAQTPSQTAGLAAQQQAQYSGKAGGSRRGKKSGSRRGKRGGSWPVWGCMSGGTRRRKRCKCKRSKSKNNRSKRHRH